MKNITYLGKSTFRNENKKFGIFDTDRLFHIHVIGKTGTGKSTLIKSMILQDIENEKGCCLFDPHGDLVESVLLKLPKHRKQDLVYVDITNLDLEYGYNPLKKIPYELRALVTSGMLDVFKKLWKNAWGVRLEHILRNTILALLDAPTAKLTDIPRMLLQKKYRYTVIGYIVNPEVKSFWLSEFPRYTNDAVVPVLNKLGAMLSYPAIRRFLVENQKTLSFRKLMDEGKIVLINLSKGHVGEDVTNIIGSLILHSIGLAGMTRVNLQEEDRKPFYCYIDEFQNFSTLSFVNFLSELRKFKLSFCLAHQYLKQLDTNVANAVVGNVGTSINFRLGTDDSHTIARAYLDIFEPIDFLYLPNYNIYLSLMIDGKPSKGFSAITLSL